MINHVRGTADCRPLSISQFLRPADFHRLELHGEFFGPLGVEDQLSVTLLASQTVVALALDRDSAFDCDDHEMLAALQPHLLAAYRNACLYSDALHGIGRADTTAAAQQLRLLTDRQHEVLGLVAAGRTSAQIASELGCREATVKKHVEHVLARLGVEKRVAAARIYLDAAPPRTVSPWWVIEGEVAPNGRPHLRSPHPTPGAD